MVNIIIYGISKTSNPYVEIINTILVQEPLCTLLHLVYVEGYPHSGGGYRTPVPPAGLSYIPLAERHFWQ